MSGAPAGRHVLGDDDVSPAEHAEVLDIADRFAADRFAPPLEGTTRVLEPVWPLAGEDGAAGGVS